MREVGRAGVPLRKVAMDRAARKDSRPLLFLRFDVAPSQGVRGFVVASHLVSLFVEIKLAFSQDEKSQCTFHRESVKERPSPARLRGTSAGVTEKAA